MNIGYVLYGYPKKSETWIPLEIKELEKRGYGPITIYDISKPLTQEQIHTIPGNDFLLCHWAMSGYSVMRWGIPFGILCHAYDIWKDNGAMLKHISKSRNCKFVGCDTDYHKSRYIEWGIDKPLKDTPVCCDVDSLYKKKDIGEWVVTGGRDKEKKGFDYTIRGFPNIRVFGSQSLERYKEIQPNISVYGWLEKEKLRELLDDCWLFVSPNVPAKDGDMDGQCTTIKEALLMELQVLTTNIAGNSEYEEVYFSTPEDISNGTNGEVYQQIPKERNTKGRKYVIDTFSPKVCIDKYLEAIEQVI